MQEIVKPKEKRNTKQRNMILECLKENSERHMTVEEILESIQNKSGHVGIATLYRNLKLLDDQNRIEKTYISEGSAPCYKILGGSCGKHTHHHMICKECGAIADFEDDLLEAIEKIILVTKDFTVTDHRVSFYGLCGKCKSSATER
jgi:Fur family ferric uptake transcriptional regulator